MSAEFRVRNTQEWQQIHDSIFTNSIPSYCEWTDITAIINVLNKIGAIDSSNHMFFAKGGGMDLDSAKPSNEVGSIEITTSGIAYILKPLKLVYEGIGTDLEWNYFRIETQPLELTGVNNNYSADSYVEEVCELTPGHYIDHSNWVNGQYNGVPLPNTARGVMRLLKGALVIFKKSSIYNSNTSTYDGRHETLGAEGFKKHIVNAKMNMK